MVGNGRALMKNRHNISKYNSKNKKGENLYRLSPSTKLNQV